MFHWHIYNSFWMQTKAHTWRPKYFYVNFRTSQRLGHELLVTPTILSSLEEDIARKCGAEGRKWPPEVPFSLIYSMILWWWAIFRWECPEFLMGMSCCPSYSLLTELWVSFRRHRYKVALCMLLQKLPVTSQDILLDVIINFVGPWFYWVLVKDSIRILLLLLAV